MKILGGIILFVCAIIIACAIVYSFAMFGHEVLGLFLALVFLGAYGNYFSDFG